MGEWAEQRGIRDQLVIITKVDCHTTGRVSMSSLCISVVDASLEKLRTSCIDILYVHFRNFDTSVEEVMNGLHTLVQQRKVYLVLGKVEPSVVSFVTPICFYNQGISDSRAWITSKHHQYARDHGKTPFVIYQGACNIMSRNFERVIIPMARVEGLFL